MRFLLVFVVLSGTAVGQNAYGPDFLNLHCTAPDSLAQVLFNIPPRPGLVPDHAANGNAVLYCDATSGTIKASFSGGPYVSIGSSSNTIFGAVNALGYGVKADGHIFPQATFSNGSNIVSCIPCVFTGTDAQGRPNAIVGQIVFGTNAFSDVSAQTSTLVSPECIIQSIDSATQIHMGTIGAISTPCNATISNGGQGYVIWGDLDSATSSQTQSISNDPLFNAWTVAANNCQALALPSGVMLVERGEFNTNSTGPCSLPPNTTFLRSGYSIYGQGPAATIIVPTPNFVANDCTSSSCFFGALGNMQLQDLQINGVGNSSCGSGFNGKNLVQISGVNSYGGLNFSLRHVIFQGWCANQTGVNGLVIGSGLNTISGGFITDSIVETFGYNSTSTNYGTGGIPVMIQIVNDQFTACGPNGCLTVNGGIWSSSHTFYGFNNTVSNAVNLSSGVTGSFTGDFIGYPTGNGVAEIGCTGCTLKLTDTVVSNSAGGSSAALTFGVGTNTIIVKGSTISDAGSSFACNGSGVVCNYFDLGGNSVSGPISTNSGGIFNNWLSTSNALGGLACTGGNFALTSGWGTSTVAGASGDSHRCHVTITGAAGAANPVLTWTFPNAYLAAPFGCNLTGTNSSLTGASLTSVSKTAAAFTFSGTPVAVTYILDISCGP